MRELGIPNSLMKHAIELENAMPSYIATYIVNGSEITTIEDGTQLVSQYIGQTAYLYITTGTNQSIRYAIDLAKLMLFESNINYTQTVEQLVTSLTDLQIAGYKTSAIPFVNISTGAIDSRINVTDAYIATDLTVAYTSIYTPDVRNDIYKRDNLPDLVISSSTGRNFANSLVSVNGVFHKTFFFNNELYAQNGFTNIRNSKKNKIAIYDTTTLGGHSTVPITLSNIDVGNNAYFSGVTLTFPNVDFTNTTPMLVLGGYLFPPNSVFRFINKNRIIIDTCKIDFINMFLNDPNTRLNNLNNNILALAESAASTTTLTTPDEIIYFLDTVYPNAFATNTGNSSLYEFQYYQQLKAPTVSTADMINYFLANYPYNTSATKNVLLANYTEYTIPDTIITTLPVSEFNNPQYIIDLLIKENTYFVVINNPTVYTKTYELYRTASPDQYVSYGNDTPRGVMLYNNSMSIPYLTYVEGDQNYHDFSLDYTKTNDDVYKTIIDPQHIPSITYDTKSYKQYPVKLIEFYSA